MKPRVIFHATADNRHQPYLLAGLAALEAADEIELRIVARWPRIRDRMVVKGGECQRISRPYPWSYCLDIHDPASGRNVRAAVDFQDWKDLFSYGDVTSCDVLFKRSYDPAIGRCLSSRFPIAVLPAGMTQAVSVTNGRHGRAFAMARIAGRIESLLTNPLRAFTWLRDRLVPEKTPPPTGGNKSTADPPLLPRDFVFFQVKCHGDGSWREAEQLNHDRAKLIRSLRSTLGDRFQGGMYFDGPPRPEFADCLSNLPSSPAEYLKIVKSAAVVISTNGFGDSVPWKLCEYLSLGKCIVTQALAFPLPTPLQPGKEVRFFETHEECAQRAAALLENPRGRTAMGDAARQYYSNHVSPAAAARRYIEAALSTTRSTGSMP